ncbi:hypothetical protein [Allocoleopsis sp.]|uniref:hypothetical protein n=1 Tax=Allocoleopsis sp. TaxID=3088169 RepID=UPI002FCEFB21
MNVKPKKVLPRDNELWQGLNDQQFEKAMGGTQGDQKDLTPVWSIGFTDVSRPSGSTSSTGQR